MDGAKGQTDDAAAAATTTPAVTSCPQMEWGDAGSFMTNFRNYFDEFISTPMDQHKLCFKMTFQKMVDKFEEMTPSRPAKDADKSATTQAASNDGA